MLKKKKKERTGREGDWETGRECQLPGTTKATCFVLNSSTYTIKKRTYFIYKIDKQQGPTV